jgi:Domain of unknown function (DUF4783)
MKTLILLIAMIMPSGLQTTNLSAVTKAISEGDATTLGTFLDTSVELTLIDKQNVYDKTQATAALRNFFSQNKPRSFNSVHQGTSRGNTSHYTIGDMVTTSGSYRVYLYYKSNGGGVLIQEMRIEK